MPVMPRTPPEPGASIGQEEQAGDLAEAQGHDRCGSRPEDEHRGADEQVHDGGVQHDDGSAIQNGMPMASDEFGDVSSAVR
jgi:hypothetical protein